MLVSLTIVRYRPIFVPFALLAMAVHRIPLLLNRNCTFWKLMGSGRNGTFDINPDWAQWALLAVWDSAAAHEEFISNSFISRWWDLFTTEKWHLVLKPVSSHGSWNGIQPFQPGDSVVTPKPVCVLTRATIRMSKLQDFWRNVPAVAARMYTSPGYVTSVGVGEAPLIRQATVSIWEDMESMTNFAYRGEEHSKVIQKTRSRDWYSEELFARFSIVSSSGTLRGKDPLTKHIT